MRALRTRLVGTLARIWNDRRSRSFALAVLVAFALRLAWVIWATGPISSELSDPAQYLSYAERFSSGSTPELYGRSTAFLPPGYPLLLAPLSFVARHTGWISVNFAASLANVVLATATVVFVAWLARIWIGPAARNPAAWIMALAPGHIYYTSVVLSETLFATLTTGLLLAASLLVRNGREGQAKALVVVGVFVGWALLVRSPGAFLVFAPALALRAMAGSWKGALRATGWVVLGTLVLIVPWTIRNAVQVGVAVPISTNNAAFLCTGHNDRADGRFDATAEGSAYCFAGSAYDRENADEAHWYRTTSSRAIGWALRHPVDEVRLTLWKTYDTMADDREALSDAEDFGGRSLFDGNERVRGIWLTLANGWHWGVLAFAAAGLCFVRATRRALPLWSTAAVYLVLVWGGLALTRYHHAIMPILVVFAAAALTALREGTDALDDPLPRLEEAAT
jgi:hypothetical protein